MEEDLPDPMKLPPEICEQIGADSESSSQVSQGRSLQISRSELIVKVRVKFHKGDLYRYPGQRIRSQLCLLVEKLVDDYHLIDRESSFAKEVTLCTQKAFKKKQDGFVCGQSQEANKCTEFDSEAQMNGDMENKKCLFLNSNLVSAVT
ncbi:hypothetical protein GOP47_0014398 [Adiantum capillus-veneris]|uniref:Uncharacterized protein n=1 Tax=Adiantum capillus-veneris TaxID=13818 RepID=A0A9D4ULK3_ADICA|nr:hypothetical protein GOP47_0014398 [Adiantum capillus-veneris]